jgi:LacI family transcriptional regulator
MPTIKDVARQSGVSISTVSAVLNNSDWVPQDTRAHVQSVIRAMGYRPNRVAQSLKKGRSNVIAVIISDLSNPYFTEVVSSLQHRLLQEQLTLAICNSDRRHDLGDRHFEFMLTRQMDGIVIIGDSVTEPVLQRWQEESDVPVVVIERDYGMDKLPTLLVDSEQAAFEATMFLIQQHYAPIAMISGPTHGVGSTTFGRSTRLQGYKRALAEAGIEYKPHYVVEGNFQLHSGEQAMMTLLNLAECPRAVFAANDLMAIGAMRAIQRLGLRIPQDIAVVGYDDIALASIVSPTLTTLAMPKQELGQTAAEILLRQLHLLRSASSGAAANAAPPAASLRASTQRIAHQAHQIHQTMLRATLVRRESA